MAIVLIVSTVFLLSLVGAVILFRFFKASALIRHKNYRAGGALGGFILIYGLLFSSYYRIEQLHNQELTRAFDDMTRKLGSAVVSGTVEPDKGPVKVRLVLESQEPDSTGGKFNFQVPSVLLDNTKMAIYAVTDDEHVMLDGNCVQEICELPESSIYLFGQKKTTDIKVPVKLRRK